MIVYHNVLYSFHISSLCSKICRYIPNHKNISHDCIAQYCKIICVSSSYPIMTYHNTPCYHATYHIIMSYYIIILNHMVQDCFNIFYTPCHAHNLHVALTYLKSKTRKSSRKTRKILRKTRKTIQGY